jgi:hypothetical protein
MIGIGWYGRSRRRETAASSAAVYAVRRDWPDGTHEFISPHATEAGARRAAERDRAYWRGGPMRPQLSAVTTSEHDFWLHARHRRDCRAPDCPGSAAMAVRGAGVRR